MQDLDIFASAKPVKVFIYSFLSFFHRFKVKLILARCAYLPTFYRYNLNWDVKERIQLESLLIIFGLQNYSDSISLEDCQN